MREDGILTSADEALKSKLTSQTYVIPDQALPLGTSEHLHPTNQDMNQ